MEASQLSAIAQYVRVNAISARVVERIGPFLATVTEASTNPFLNYAIPDDGASPVDSDIARLIRSFEDRSRVPRLEYFASLAPDVWPVLARAGFEVEGELAVMTCTAKVLTTPPVIAKVDIKSASTDGEFDELDRVQAIVYDGGLTRTSDGARLKRLVDRGGLVAVAVDENRGIVVGGGICDVVHDGVGELASFAVAASHRRRGIGAALTGFISRAAFQLGAETVFLTPGDTTAQRVYARAGFVDDGTTQVHVRYPAGSG